MAVSKSVMIGVAIFVGFVGSAWFARQGVAGAERDLKGMPDQLEASARQSRQDIASIVWLLIITNTILAGIFAALLYPD